MILMAVFLASLAGSAHCAGMCGGFVALYSANRSGSIFPHLAYSLGRLASYLALGAAAGYFGRGLDEAGAFLGLQHAAAIFLAVIALLWGVAVWRGSLASFTHSGRAASLVASAYRRLFARASRMRPEGLALSIGLLSALLPCGWLYLYVAAAAGSASPLDGAAILFVFWLGTLPVMLALGKVTEHLSERARKFLPRFSAAVLIAAAIFSFEQHLGFFHRLTSTPAHCAETSGITP